MPIYEYLCEQCGSLIEAIQKFSDAPLTKCEKCNGKLNKVVSQSSFVLKGSGWYMTDYSKKCSAAAKTEGSSPKSESSPAKSETQTESSGGCGAGACNAKTD
ncbi:MAG: FmdB family zinc ribbon protein [Acidobacteriota bacterium]